MEPINLDVIFARDQQGYTAWAMTYPSGSWASGHLSLTDPALLGPNSLAAALTPDAPPPSDSSDFIKSLRDLMSGLGADRGAIDKVGTGLHNALPSSVQDLY